MSTPAAASPRSSDRSSFSNGWTVSAILLGVILLILALSLRPETVANLLASIGEGTREMLQSIPPVAYFICFALLPAFGFPLTLFYLTVPGVTGSLPVALLLSWVSVLVNMAVTYGLVRFVLRRPIDRWVRKRGKSIPRISRENEWKLIVLMRASPTPWLLQSILLTLGEARFLPYLFWSLPVQGAIGATIIIAGKSALNGNLGWAIAGIFCFLLLSFALSALYKRFSGKTEEKGDG